MDDFERRLDLELARLLDPIVDRPAPRRRRRRGSNPLKAIAGGLSGMPLDVSAFAETAPVAVIVIPASPT